MIMKEQTNIDDQLEMYDRCVDRFLIHGDTSTEVIDTIATTISREKCSPFYKKVMDQLHDHAHQKSIKRHTYIK